ncbi:MAG: DUF202 domain-containing protein [Jiangellales bacterium]
MESGPPPPPPRRPPRSDAGLAGERTSLAWTRIGLTLVAVPTGLAAYSASASLAVTLVSATLAAAVGLWLLVRSLRAARAAPNMVDRRLMVVDGQRVVLATATVVLIGVAAFTLVLGQA